MCMANINVHLSQKMSKTRKNAIIASFASKSFIVYLTPRGNASADQCSDTVHKEKNTYSR